MNRILPIVLLMLMLSSISNAYEKLPVDIDWYKGSMDEALIAAGKAKRPMFVYWGAVWCPPCNQIKKTIFTSQAFRQTIKAFVPVYMDGDTVDAQKWAEKLKTAGYPTMLILSPEGAELARLPTGISAKEYSELMQLTLEELTPLSHIIKRALKKQATASEWRRLAGHSWTQDKDINVEHLKMPELIIQLLDHAVGESPEVRSRLFIHMLVTLADGEIKENLSRQEKKKKLDHLKQFLAIVSDKQLYKANLESLNWSFDSVQKYFLPIIEKENELWMKVGEQWMLSANNTGNDQELSLDDRISSLLPRVFWEKNQGQKKVSQVWQTYIEERVNWAAKTADIKYERQSVMSTVVYLLQAAELVDKAREIALLEIKKSSSPHYFMSLLASLEKKQGNDKEAREWTIKAWESAKGINSRFQWGVSMMQFLMAESGQDPTLISSKLKAVIEPILVSDEAFMGRNLKRFESLSTLIKKWREEGNQEIREIKKASLDKGLGQACLKAKDQKLCRDWMLKI